MPTKPAARRFMASIIPLPVAIPFGARPQSVVHSVLTPVVPTHTRVFRLPIEDCMHAIIETGGKQYRVAPGDVIRVEKLAGDVGSEIELPVKAAFNDGGELVAGGTVKATIVGAAGATRSSSSSSSARSSTRRPSGTASPSPM